MGGTRVSRRDVLVSAAAVGGALTLGFAARPALATHGQAAELTAWIVITPDDRVVIRFARAEMGQGALTGLAMLVAEELDCDWQTVSAELVEPQENVRRGHAWGDMSTGGSRSIQGSESYLRRAGATARAMLIAAAAARWNVPAAQCGACNGVITHMPSGRTLRFAELAEAAAAVPPPKDVAPKKPEQWTLLGTPRNRIDVPDKVTGKPIYGIDVVVPGMLHAAIRHAPMLGGRLRGVDPAPALARRGVHKVVRLDDAVAVVADTWWRAEQAVAALAPDWTPGEGSRASSGEFYARLREALDGDEFQVGREEGDVDAAFPDARIVSAEYSVPLLAHATMEPQNCTAQVTADKVEVWAPTQDAELSLNVAAKAAGVGIDKVVLHPVMLGGGFGRRGVSQDFVHEAVTIAREVGRPVKLLWSREEDIRRDHFRPAAVARLRAALDADGLPKALHVRLAAPSVLAAISPELVEINGDRMAMHGLMEEMRYAVPHYRVEYAMRNLPVQIGPWRSVNHSQNAFFKECFVDELAQAAGCDPYQYRRMLLRDAPKARAVLDAAAERAGWSKPALPGVFRGIALHEASDSTVAQVVEISLENGAPKVRRIVSAIDCGHVVNPRGIAEQTESAIVYGLAAALYGEITITDGRVRQSNFHDYPMLRLADMPQIETVLVPSGGFFGGVGEPPLTPVAPALCNAIFAATGRRVRSLPLLKG